MPFVQMIDRRRDHADGRSSERSGLRIGTLRCHEKRGGIDPSWRADGYRRDCDETVLNWIRFLKALKSTHMPLAKIETYARLRRESAQTSAERRRMLDQQRERVRGGSPNSPSA